MFFILPVITGTPITRLFLAMISLTGIKFYWTLPTLNLLLVISLFHFLSNKTPISHQMHNLNSHSDNLNADANYNLNDSINVISPFLDADNFSSQYVNSDSDKILSILLIPVIIRPKQGRIIKLKAPHKINSSSKYLFCSLTTKLHLNLDYRIHEPNANNSILMYINYDSKENVTLRKKIKLDSLNLLLMKKFRLLMKRKFIKLIL